MTDLDVRRSAPTRQAARRRAPANNPKTTEQGGGAPDVAVNGLLDIADGAWLRADGYLPGPATSLSPRALVAEARAAGLAPELHGLTYGWRRLPAPVQRAIHRLDPLGSRPRTAPFAHTLLLIARA